SACSIIKEICLLLIRFFLDVASDCPASDSVNHSLSFISDGNVLALHRLLWNNQEKIGQYLSSNRCLTRSRPDT
ncbi:neurofibromin isoform X1, partial [Tachysurus ichikawai]